MHAPLARTMILDDPTTLPPQTQTHTHAHKDPFFFPLFGLFFLSDTKESNFATSPQTNEGFSPGTLSPTQIYVYSFYNKIFREGI